MSSISETPSLSLEPMGQGLTLHALGDWTVQATGALFTRMEEITADKPLIVDMSHLGQLDTAGAWLIHRLRRRLAEEGQKVEVLGASPLQQSLLDTVAANDAPCETCKPEPNSLVENVAELGKGVIQTGATIKVGLAFVGLVLSRFTMLLIKPQRLRLTALVYHMEMVGLKALPIVGLISVLIGIVIAHQGAFQLRAFGAEIFTVNLVAISQVREFGIMLTAIMLAGRSGSAYAAEIGSMKLHEEVDAMRALGIDPIQTLVMPRVLALVLMMPLLTFYADMLGILGGLLISWATLDIPPGIFIERAHNILTVNDVMVGLIKAPIFGAIIGMTGCWAGLQVQHSAESLGRQTTNSVVQSIFLILVLDAFFAVFFTTIGF